MSACASFPAGGSSYTVHDARVCDLHICTHAYVQHSARSSSPQMTPSREDLVWQRFTLIDWLMLTSSSEPTCACARVFNSISHWSIVCHSNKLCGVFFFSFFPVTTLDLGLSWDPGQCHTDFSSSRCTLTLIQAASPSSGPSLHTNEGATWNPAMPVWLY